MESQGGRRPGGSRSSHSSSSFAERYNQDRRKKREFSKVSSASGDHAGSGLVHLDIFIWKLNKPKCVMGKLPVSLTPMFCCLLAAIKGR